MEKKHASHPSIVNRLKRAQGHLGSILSMFAEGRGCLELAQQLYAVENAISNAKRELIHDHIEHCLEAEDGVQSKEALREFKALAKYL